MNKTLDPKNKKTDANSTEQFLFNSQNYTYLIAACAIIVLGLVLMSGTTNIYSVLKIRIAPLIMLIGFGVGIFAIMKKR